MTTPNANQAKPNSATFLRSAEAAPLNKGANWANPPIATAATEIAFNQAAVSFVRSLRTSEIGQ